MKVLIPLMLLSLISCNSGSDGQSGANGIAGESGKNGASGEKGDVGAKGDKGDKGDTGSAGPNLHGMSFTFQLTKNTPILFIPNKELKLTVPRFIMVPYGNAGNHKATIRAFGQDDYYSGLVKCVYQGQSSQSNPTPTSREFELGRVYKLQKCIRGTIADSDIDTNSPTYLNEYNMNLVDITVNSEYNLGIRLHNVGGNISETVGEIIFNLVIEE